jgi:hypothetical protein
VSVLLRQPNGFEGFFPRSVLAHFDDLAAPILVHENLLAEDVGVSVRGMTTDPHRHDQVLVGVDVFLDLDSEIRKEIQPPRDHLRNAFMTLKGAGFGLVGHGPPRNAPIEVLQPSFEVVAVEGLNCLAINLHVLLRHRPRSIPQAQDSA